MKFESIDIYILKDKTERQKHLQLNTNCIEIGGTDSRNYRGLLAHYLKTTIPFGKKILLCHACNNHKCSNVNHIYWGTNSENVKDAYDCGANSGDKIRLSLINKYGSEEAWKKQLSKQGKKAKGKILYPEVVKKRIELIKNSNIDFSKWGWVQKVSDVTGMRHQKINKFFKQHLPDLYIRCYQKRN